MCDVPVFHDDQRGTAIVVATALINALKVVRKEIDKINVVINGAEGASVFPMANPTPEIMPDLALKAGAVVVGTGRSDFSNQINNVLAFPGIFRGALDVRASDINEEMKMAASIAIASLVSEEEPSPIYIIPKAFDKQGTCIAQIR